jgi:hypothetical protein
VLFVFIEKEGDESDNGNEGATKEEREETTKGKRRNAPAGIKLRVKRRHARVPHATRRLKRRCETRLLPDEFVSGLRDGGEEVGEETWFRRWGGGGDGQGGSREEGEEGEAEHR